MVLALEPKRPFARRRVAVAGEVPRTHRARERREQLVPDRIDRPLPDLVRHGRDLRRRIDVLVVPVRARHQLLARQPLFGHPVREREVVRRRELPRGGRVAQRARIVLLVLRHPLPHRLEVRVAQFVSDRERGERRRVAVGVRNRLQLAPDESVHGLSVADLVALAHPRVRPDPRFGMEEHTQLVRRPERGRRRTPRVETDGVHAVLLLKRTEHAQPFGVLHPRDAVLREVGVLHVAAREDPHAVQREQMPVRPHRAEPKPDAVREIGRVVPQHERVEPRMELVPADGLLGERGVQHREAAAAGRRRRADGDDLQSLHGDRLRRGAEAVRNLNAQMPVRGRGGEHARGAQRMGAAELDLSEDAVPHGLHARAVGMRLAREVVAAGVVDDEPQLVPAGRETRLRHRMDMRRGERIACAQAFSVPERLARPHHAFEEQFKRMAAVVRRQLDGARPRRLADILPLLHERLGLRLVQGRLEVALRPAPPEMRRRERAGQFRLAREAVPFDVPDARQRAVRPRGRANDGRGDKPQKRFLHCRPLFLSFCVFARYYTTSPRGTAASVL